MTNYEAFMLAIQQSAADDDLTGDKRSRAVSSDHSSENGSDEITAIMNFEGTGTTLLSAAYDINLADQQIYDASLLLTAINKSFMSYTASS